jgi:hypothetical protein
MNGYRQGVRKLWHSWKRFGQFIGDAVGRILLTVFYFTVFAPFGIAVRLTMDPLDIKGLRPAGWVSRPTAGRPRVEDARRLF